MKLQTILKTFRTYSNPLWYYVLQFNLAQPSTTQIKLRNKLKFIVRPRLADHYILSEVFLHQDHQLPLHNLNPHSSVVFDIGAHIGIFSILASLHARQVFAYEPAPDKITLLEKNIQLNKRPNIVVHPLAINNHSRKQPLHMTTNRSHSHSLFKPLIKSTLQQSPTLVNCSTLQDQIKAHQIDQIDLLKLDCEGAEFPILTSLPSHIFKLIDQIILEYHNRASHQATHHDLVALLKSHHFQAQIVRTLNPTTGILYAKKNR
jgi:FkbM family methyltransferase